MSDQAPVSAAEGHTGAAPHTSELFADLVLHQTQLALMLLGKIPHPDTGKAQCDLDQARVAIDLLEMLELKTRGNLTKDEEALLKHSLMTLRMAFVEAVESGLAQASSQTETKPAAQEQSAASTPAKDSPASAERAGEQPRKRFVKKY